MKNEEPRELLVATANQGKVAEIKSLLASLSLKSLDEFPHVSEVAETGETFRENAILKARGYALQTQEWTLADDSGLEVTALDNAPGVYSARYGGDGLSDADRVERLLDALSRTGDTKRRARFVSEIAIADPDGRIVHNSTGTCEGRIASGPRGSNGFGYDPVFIPDGYDQTFGELANAAKEIISHRARALAAARPFLMKLFSR
ncbi:MAG: XTP/dITP diphosphohydrolase [Acidobacteriota bacterium]|jgi:XTP/dITP diphosphohydrolase|nr:XTP/dITP diphosphohydrolase [Acidobacteriota bacterium]